MSSTGDGSAELRRGWRIVAVSAVGVGLGLSPLPFYSIGVFTKPLAEEFGWARAEIQLVLAFITLGALIGSPIVGALMDRIGVRRVVLVSVVGLGVGLAALGLLTNSPTTFYAIGFVMALLGAGTTPVTWSRAIFDWFVARRGLALGLALTGTGISAFFIPRLTTFLVAEVGWRFAYVTLGLLPILIALPLCWLWLKPAPRAGGRAQAAGETGFTFQEAVRSYRFYVIFVSFFLAGLATGGVSTNVVPMLTDRGFDAETAAWVAGAQGLAVVAGRFITGYLLDRVWAPGMAAFVFALPAAACFVLSLGSPSITVSTAAVILVGFAGGAEFDLIAYFTARYFGLRKFGVIYGTLYALFVTASGIAPAMFGRAYDMTGSYEAILQAGAVCFLLGAALVLTLGRYPKAFASGAH
jgi:MFS family permease